MRTSGFPLSILAILGLGSSLLVAADSTKPNIVLILADDLGYGDVGCYKKRPSKIPTPNMDRIAAEGVRFTDAHSPSSVCSPTRYALLTGRYAWRTRLQRGVLGPWGPPLIAPDRMTVATLLQKQGYATACIGKWHLGWQWPTRDGKPPATGSDRLSNVDFSQPIAQGPTTRGFDYYFGTDVPNYPPYCFIENDRTVGPPSVVNKPEFNRPGPMLPGWDWTDVLPTLTQRAVKYVEDAANCDKPFFLYLPLTSPHYPVVPAPEFRDKTAVGDFGDFVFQTDWTVGQVLAALEHTNLAKNTLVIFTSDNGPEITGEVRPGAYDRVQQFQHHSMDGLRGAKRDLWEGGHRVPFLARWPNKIPAGSVSDEIICHVDFMATVAAITGALLPETAAVDSYNVLPALLGEKRDRPIREATVHHSGSGKFAIRQGDWVFIDAPTGDDNGPRAGEPDWFKMERGYQPHSLPGELFQLREDLIERRNLYSEHPEIVRELKGLLEKYQQSGRSTPGQPQANDVPAQPARANTPPKSSSAIKPNVLLMFVDNLGYGDLGCYGNGEVKTPHIDRLAREGVRCTDFYIASPSCSPSRGAILTGRHPERNGMNWQLSAQQNIGGYGLPLAEKILPQYLQPLGYATGAFGKWNIGFGPGARPTERGFDEFFGHASGNIHYYKHLYAGQNDLRFGTMPVDRRGEYCTDLFANAAIDFIRRHQAQPWFVYLPFNAVHFVSSQNTEPGEKIEWQVPAKYLALYGCPPDEPDPKKRFRAVLSALDDAVGRVLGAVDNLKLRERTIVFLISDNGAFMLPGRGLEVQSNKPLREGGVTTYEGGVRVPAMVRWPGQIQPGSVCLEMLSSLDVLPTVLAAAGAELPTDCAIDGRDVKQTLAGQAKSPHAALHWVWNQGRTQQWRGIRAGNDKLVRSADNEPWQLYDLTNDLGEANDLAKDQPELVNSLAAKFEHWQAAVKEESTTGARGTR